MTVFHFRNTGGRFYGLEADKESFGMTLKTRLVKEKDDKLGFIKI